MNQNNNTKNLTVGMVSLGCPKNLVDSENILGLLRTEGYQITNDAKNADIIIVNTCGFIGDAKEESINAILEMAQYKTSGKCSLLVATGCMAERYSKEIREEMPEVDVIIGTGKFPEIVDYINQGLNHKKLEVVGDIDRVFDDDIMPKVRITPDYTSYVKIADGCDKFCTYCIIPKLRGKYRSRTMKSIVTEIKELVSNGVKEVILIAQDTSCYGIDLYGKPSLAALLEEVSKIEGLKFIRFLYTYPEDINEELIEVLKNNKNICPYIDMPIQHINNSILKLMGRKDTKEDIINKIADLRKEIPDIILRTSLIVGFPGEGEKEFDELYEFVRDIKFDKLGVFMYSPEEGTPAANFVDKVDDNIKIDRYNKIMALQKEISLESNKKYINKVLEVLIEDNNNEFYVGRSYMDAPSIDGSIYIKTQEVINNGDIVKVKINQVSEYDILGEIVT